MIIFGSLLDGLNGPGLGATLPTSFVSKMNLIQSASIAPLSTDLLIAPTRPTIPQEGTCTSDGLMIWRAATATVAGHWERIRVGEHCTVISDIAPITRGTCDKDHLQNCPGGVYVEPTKVMNVGPFTIPVVHAGAQYIWGLDDYSKIKPEQAAMVLEQIKKQIDYPGRSNWVLIREHWQKDSPEPGTISETIYYQSGKPTGNVITATWPSQAAWGTWLTYAGWLRVLGLAAGDHYEDRYFGFDRERYTPIATFKHPDSGADYGMWMRLSPVGPMIPALTATLHSADGSEKTIDWSTQSFQLQFMVAPMPDKGLLGGFWDWIMKYVKRLAVSFYTGVWDVAEELSETLCAMAATPGAITATGSKAGPYGTAAGAVVEIALDKAGNCPVPNPTPEGIPAPPPKKTPWGLIALGVGVAGLAVVLITQQGSKKKAA